LGNVIWALTFQVTGQLLFDHTNATAWCYSNTVQFSTRNIHSP